jgi:hypothetical protein
VPGVFRYIQICLLRFARLPVMKAIWRALIEIAFIVFLFYSNLLMGEYGRSAKGREMGLAWAIADILTPANLAIALAAAFIGYVVFEFLRSKF